MASSQNILTALSPEHLLIEGIALQERQLLSHYLAPLEPSRAFGIWLDTIRAIEEFINLLSVDWDDEEFERTLISLPLTLDLHLNPDFKLVSERLLRRFGRNFLVRFTQLAIQGAASRVSFGSHGVFDVASGFSSVGSMIGYLQSRRRHFIALLHMIPSACRGRQMLEPLDSLPVFLPMVEFAGIQIYTAQSLLNVKLAREKLGLPAQASADLAMLDPLFLEPERAPITSMDTPTEAIAIWKTREALSPDRLFSAAELRNDIVAVEAAYYEFELANTDFGPAAALVRRLSKDFVDKDFWVTIAPAELDGLFDECNAPPALRSAMVNSGQSYMACLSTYAPFVLVGGAYRSTVTLLSRFVYQWRAKTLDRRKRYQIRAGFIFEKAVAGEVERQGFVWQKDIKRIEQKEFDVVTVRDGVIWNIQCKNNFTDVNDLERDSKRFAVYNSRLVNAYENALVKERKREKMLKDKLSLSEIQHMIVSRFPVISHNPRFVPFSRISKFGEIAQALE